MLKTSTPAYYGTPEFGDALEAFPPHVQTVLELSAELCEVPGVTVPTTKVDFENVIRTHEIAREFAENAGLQVIELPADPENGKPYPYLMVTFSDLTLDGPNFTEAVALIGHTDVVPPKSDDQFDPYLKDGDLYARGSADMKTVVATYLAWMAERQKEPGPKPPFITMISSCEENGSAESNHTGAALDWLEYEKGVTIRFAVVGERTGELEWMDPDIQVGPICKENRAWRWMKIEAPKTDEGNGRSVLNRLSGIVQEGRERIQQLNTQILPERAAQQPGLRSGFVNPTMLIGPDYIETTDGWEHEPTWIIVNKEPGVAKHSAAMSAADLSLAEQFEAIVKSTETTFGAEKIFMGEVVIGERGNFNSWDESGHMKLMVIEDPDTIQEWIESIENKWGLNIRTSKERPDGLCEETGIAGIDIRELPEHKNAVQTWIQEIRRLWSAHELTPVLDRPSWKCPADQRDLLALEKAYEDVIGSPSPSLVKLHGNDGGELAARQQAESAAYANSGLGRAVVFGQVGRSPHGKNEFHRGASIAPYWEILDKWADSYTG